MNPVLLIDFGSTFTKVVLVDTDEPGVLAASKSPTTVREGIMTGLGRALDGLARAVVEKGFRLGVTGAAGGRHAESERGGIEFFQNVEKIACSSAAGGLRMVAVGLVPDFTAAAAKAAALGAGARVLEVFSYGLGPEDLARLRALDPDIILLAGGTDGGNETHLIENARMLAGSGIMSPVIVAGNRNVSPLAASILKERSQIDVRVTENVMPRLGEINVSPAREAIRRVFIERIVRAKGYNDAFDYVGDILMPTPAAVMEAAALLESRGFGELMVIDIGGATTDAHSAAEGAPGEGVVLRGLREPFLKRTVEGDLGMRYTAPSVLEAVGLDRFRTFAAEIVPGAGPDSPGDAEIRSFVETLGDKPDTIPDSGFSRAIDYALAVSAAAIAVLRHCGRQVYRYTPAGRITVQYGKDLRDLPKLIGTGGPLSNAPEPERILKRALKAAAEFWPAGPGTGVGADLSIHDGSSSNSDAEPLLPETPEILIDTGYILWAAGLLSKRYPETAYRILLSGLS